MGKRVRASGPFFIGAPSMGALLDVKVLSRADHSE